MAKKDCLVEEISINGIDYLILRHYGTVILEFNVNSKTVNYIGGYSQSDAKFINIVLERYRINVKAKRKNSILGLYEQVEKTKKDGTTYIKDINIDLSKNHRISNNSNAYNISKLIN